MFTEVKACTVDFINIYWFDTDQGCYKHARRSDSTREQLGYIEILYSIRLPIHIFGGGTMGHPKLALEKILKLHWVL